MGGRGRGLVEWRGSGRASDFAELRAGLQLLGTSAPDLGGGAVGRHLPLHGIPFHPFLIDFRDASVEAAPAVQPQQDSEGGSHLSSHFP